MGANLSIKSLHPLRHVAIEAGHRRCVMTVLYCKGRLREKLMAIGTRGDMMCLNGSTGTGTRDMWIVTVGTANLRCACAAEHVESFTGVSRTGPIGKEWRRRAVALGADGDDGFCVTALIGQLGRRWLRPQSLRARKKGNFFASNRVLSASEVATLATDADRDQLVDRQ